MILIGKIAETPVCVDLREGESQIERWMIDVLSRFSVIMMEIDTSKRTDQLSI